MAGAAPQPPPGLVTPYLPQLVMTVGLGALAAAALLVAMVLALRQRRGTLLAMLLGAAAGSLNEAPLDVFVLAYYPPRGQWTLYESFGRPIPVWVLPAHMLLFAAVPYVLAAAMRRWGARRVGWSGCLALAVCDVLIEMPMQTPYYGEQPFRVFGFPMAMAAVNAATMTAIAVTVLLVEPRLAGRHQALAALLPLAALPAGTFVTGFPVFGAVAAGAPTGIIAVAGVVSIAAAVLAVQGLLALGRSGARTREAEPAVAVSCTTSGVAGCGPGYLPGMPRGATHGRTPHRGPGRRSDRRPRRRPHR